MPIYADMPRYEQYFTDVTTSAKAFIELGLEQHRSVWMNELDMMTMMMMMRRRRRRMMQERRRWVPFKS